MQAYDGERNEYVYNNQDNIRSMKRRYRALVDIKYCVLGIIALYVLMSMLGIREISIEIIKEHAVTLICSCSIIIMAVWHAIQNRRVYSYIVYQYKDITNKKAFITLSENIRGKIRQNPNMKTNIQTTIEEYIANEAYGKRSLLQVIKGIKAVSSTLIIIGVLGTFMGLVIGLKSFGVQNGEMNIEQISQFLQGVNTAFYTSIIGILGSLFMQCVIHKYSCEEEIVKWMLKLEIVLNEQIEDKTRKNMMDVILGIGNRLDSLESLGKSLNVQEDIKSELKIAVQGICEISDGLKAIKELKIAAQDLNKFNTAFKDNIGSFTGVMAQSFEVIRDLAIKTSDMSSQFEKLQQGMELQHDVNVSIRSYIEMTYNNMIDMSKVLKYQEDMQKTMYQEVTASLDNVQKQTVSAFQQSQQFEIRKQQGIQNMGNQIKQYIEATYNQQGVTYSHIQEEIKVCFKQIGSEINALMSGIKSSMSSLETPLNNFANILPVRIEQLESSLEIQLGNQKKMLDVMREQQKQAFEQYIGGFGQIGQRITENIQNMDDHLIQEMTLQRQDIKNKVSLSSELIGEHKELVSELQVMVSTVQDKMKNFDSSFAEKVGKTLKEFESYVQVMNKTLQAKIDIIYNEHIVDELAKAIANMPKEG